jgi:hypothetical protein
VGGFTNTDFNDPKKPDGEHDLTETKGHALILIGLQKNKRAFLHLIFGFYRTLSRCLCRYVRWNERFRVRLWGNAIDVSWDDEHLPKPRCVAA